MKSMFFVLASFFIVIESRAAINPSHNNSEMTPVELELQLKKNHAQRLDWLKSSDTNVLLFEKVAFGDQYHLQDRWRALYSIASLSNDRAKENIKKAIESEDWFMRDAGLKASIKFDRRNAKNYAISLLQKDVSLIVRTTSVKVLHELNAVETEALLWKELMDPKNFRLKQSLWIRKYLVKTLYSFQKSKNMNAKEKIQTKINFARLLEDKDEALHSLALEALSYLEGSTWDKSQANVQARVWKDWLSKQ